MMIDQSGDCGNAAGEMAPFVSSFVNPACPWLPEIHEIQDFSVTRRHGGSKGALFYLDALRYAQSLWRVGKPAQALLQLNKAWMADLAEDGAVLDGHPPPYRALVWILENASSGDRGFLGNPVRHFQHLASRMSGSFSEIRAWRAWLCFRLAEKVLNGAHYPRDGEQIAREGLWIPSLARAMQEVSNHGWPGELRTIVRAETPLQSGVAGDRAWTTPAQKQR